MSDLDELTALKERLLEYVKEMETLNIERRANLDEIEALITQMRDVLLRMDIPVEETDDVVA